MPTQAPYHTTAAAPLLDRPPSDGIYGAHGPAASSGPVATESTNHGSSHTAQYGHHSSFDTHYIEDYLRLIESMAGENPQMALQANRLPSLGAMSAAQFPPITGHTYPGAYQHKPENFSPPPSLAGSLMSEDVRKTILSVLGQEGEKGRAAANSTDVGHSSNLPPTITNNAPKPSMALPSIDQIVRSIKAEEVESNDKAEFRVDQPADPPADPLSDDRVEFTASEEEEEEEENDVVKRLIQEESNSEHEQDELSGTKIDSVSHSKQEHCSKVTNKDSVTPISSQDPPSQTKEAKAKLKVKQDKHSREDSHSKHELHKKVKETVSEKTMNGREEEAPEIKQEVLDEVVDEENLHPVKKSKQAKSRDAKIRKEKKQANGLTKKIKEEVSENSEREERPALKVSIRRQKRKKKIPVKLYKEDMMETDDEDDDNEEEDITYCINKPKTAVKRGRPRKDKVKDKTKTKSRKEEDDQFPPKISKRGRKRKLKRKLQCAKCIRVFSKPEALLKHSILHERELLFSCHVCGMKYARPGELTRHLRKHAGETYNCPECNQEFQDSKDFKKHRNDFHDDPKPFLCTFHGCLFRSDKPSNLEKHAAIHSGIRMYNCSRCGRDFSQSNGLRSHLRSCLQERKYLCDICGQKFNHLQSLKSHRMLHTGEKPHQCRDCGARFTDHRNFKRHRRIHENLFPYPCTYCEKRFRHSNSLKAHVRTHTMEPPPEKGMARKKVVPALEGEIKQSMERKTVHTSVPPLPTGSIADILSPTNMLPHDSLPPIPDDFRMPVSTREAITSDSLALQHASALRLPPHSSLMPAMSQALAGRMEMHLTPNESYLAHSREDMRLTSPHHSLMAGMHSQEDLGMTSPRPQSLHENMHPAHSQEDLRLMSPRPTHMRDDYHVSAHEDMRLASPHPSQMREDMRLTSPHPSHMREDLRLTSPHPSHMRDDLHMTSPHPPQMRDDLRLTSPHPAHMPVSPHPSHIREDARYSSQMWDDLRLKSSHGLTARDSLPFSLHHSLPTRDDLPVHLPPAHSFSLMYRDGAGLQPHDPLHLATREAHNSMVFPPRDDYRMFQRDYKYS